MSKRLGKLSDDDLEMIENEEDAKRIIKLRCENRWHNDKKNKKKWVVTEHISDVMALSEQVSKAKPELNIDPVKLTNMVIAEICGVENIFKNDTVKPKCIENLTAKDFSSDPNLLPEHEITGEIDTNDILNKIGSNFISLSDEEKSIVSNSHSIRELKHFCDKYNIDNERLMAIEKSTLGSLNINKNINESKYNCFYNVQKFMLYPHDIGNRNNLMELGINRGKGYQEGQREITITFIYFNITISKHPEVLDHLISKFHEYNIDSAGNDLYKLTGDMRIAIRNFIFSLNSEEPISLDELIDRN